jgi:hypothetical protein
MRILLRYLNQCKLSLAVLAGVCAAQSFGQEIVELRPGSAAYNEIVAAAIKGWKSRDEYRVGRSLDVVRQFGRWALVFDRVTHKGPTGEAFEWASVLYYDPNAKSRFRPAGWWRSSQVVDKAALRYLAAKKKQLPAKFFAAPPLKLKLM